MPTADRLRCTLHLLRPPAPCATLLTRKRLLRRTRFAVKPIPTWCLLTIAKNADEMRAAWCVAPPRCLRHGEEGGVGYDGDLAEVLHQRPVGVRDRVRPPVEADQPRAIHAPALL